MLKILLLFIPMAFATEIAPRDFAGSYVLTSARAGYCPERLIASYETGGMSMGYGLWFRDMDLDPRSGTRFLSKLLLDQRVSVSFSETAITRHTPEDAETFELVDGQLRISDRQSDCVYQKL